MIDLQHIDISTGTQGTINQLLKRRRWERLRKDQNLDIREIKEVVEIESKDLAETPKEGDEDEGYHIKLIART